MDYGRVLSFEASCVVPDDPGEVVRGARPLTAEDAVRLREQMIGRLLAQSSRPRNLPEPATTVEQVRRAMRDWQATRS